MGRLTVEFSESFGNALRAAAEKRGTTKVDLIRRAIALFLYLQDEVLDKEGRKLSVTSKEDRVLKDIVFD